MLGLRLGLGLALMWLFAASAVRAADAVFCLTRYVDVLSGLGLGLVVGSRP